jgi:hypothetical protein
MIARVLIMLLLPDCSSSGPGRREGARGMVNPVMEAIKAMLSD